MEKVIIGAIIGAAVVGGAAGWLLLGPLWTIAGVVAGPPFALAAWGIFFAFAKTEPASHLPASASATRH